MNRALALTTLRLFKSRCRYKDVNKAIDMAMHDMAMADADDKYRRMYEKEVDNDNSGPTERQVHETDKVGSDEIEEQDNINQSVDEASDGGEPPREQEAVNREEEVV